MTDGLDLVTIFFQKSSGCLVRRKQSDADRRKPF